jgi:cystathionine beta-lyase/cystathionine gamma-synthase
MRQSSTSSMQIRLNRTRNAVATTTRKMRVAKTERQDQKRPFGKARRALVAEIESVVSSEKHKLADFRKKVAASLSCAAPAAASSLIWTELEDQIVGACSTLDQLQLFVSSSELPDDQVFAELMGLGGFALRRAAATRALLVRHTPTLRGYPESLDPAQNARLEPKRYTVDYMRGGYILFQQPGDTPPVRYADHPIMAAQASEFISKLYRDSDELVALAFTSGIAAIDTLIDVLVSYSAQSGRGNAFGKDCWIEIRRRLSARDTAHVTLYDDASEGRVHQLIADEDVQAVLIECMQNHPGMRVADLHAIRRQIAGTTFAKPKFLIFDHVMTFDTDIFKLLHVDAWPANLFLVVFVSGIKFVQCGFDCAKAGFVVLKKTTGVDKLETDLIEARAGSGRAPSLEELYAVNSDTRFSIQSRMRRYDDNTRRFARRLDEFCSRHALATVSSPWIEKHPHHRRTRGGGGRVVYLRLENPDDPDGRATLELYRELADTAAEHKLPLIAASNFGFAVPHIHVVRHEDVGVSLRCSPGSVTRAMADRVFDHLCAVLHKTQTARRERAVVSGKVA